MLREDRHRPKTLCLINDQNQLIIRAIESSKNTILTLKNTSRVVQMFMSQVGSIFTIHRNGKVELVHQENEPKAIEFQKLIANHNIVKADGILGQYRNCEMFFQTDKGLLIPYATNGCSREIDVHSLRVSDFQALPMFTVVDTRGDVLLYNKYKEKLEFMDRGSGYFSFLVNSHTKVKATQDCIIIYVTRGELVLNSFNMV